MKRSDYFSNIEATFYSADNLRLVRAFIKSVQDSDLLPSSAGYEIGCGYGLAASVMLSHVKTLSVWDIDSQSLEFIKWKYKDSVLVCLGNEIPLNADLIYYFMSLHHMPYFRESVSRSINHILNIRGKGVALCELIPREEQKFHLKEPSVFDGLAPESFDFIKDMAGIKTKYVELPDISHNNTEYKCYSLIIMPS